MRANTNRRMLERWARRGKGEHRLAVRSRIILDSADGMPGAEIAARLNLSPWALSKGIHLARRRSWRIRTDPEFTPTQHPQTQARPPAPAAPRGRLPLPPDPRLVAEPDRDPVQHPQPPGPRQRQLHLGPRPAPRHRRLHRRHLPAGDTVRMEEGQRPSQNTPTSIGELNLLTTRGMACQ